LKTGYVDDRYPASRRAAMSTTLPEALPLPARARAPGDALAWIIAVLPLPIYAISLGAFILHITLSPSASTVISIGFYAGLMAVDRRALRRAGLTRLPKLWWVILAPGYLWQRASILQRGRAAFWVMLAAIAATLVVQFLVVPRYANTLLTLTGQVGCDIGKPDVLKLFDSLPAVKQAGITARSIEDVQKVANSPAERACKGIIQGSDGKHYLTEYYNTTKDKEPYISIVVHTASDPM
jgi:hypothetical protein